jgi:hypothetical protein
MFSSYRKVFQSVARAIFMVCGWRIVQNNSRKFWNHSGDFMNKKKLPNYSKIIESVSKYH